MLKHLAVTSSLTALLTTLLASSAIAQDQAPPNPGIFAPFLVGNGCVPLQAIKDAGAQFSRPLKSATFNFLRGVYVSVPPVSTQVPPGDRAILARGPTGEILIMIADDHQTCARFWAPPFMVKMIEEIETGIEADPPGKDL